MDFHCIVVLHTAFRTQITIYQFALTAGSRQMANFSWENKFHRIFENVEKFIPI